MNNYKRFVSVDVRAVNLDQFAGTPGLMGSYPSGHKLARDGVTLMDDSDIFGKEWQVLATEPILFHSLEGPQHPQECAMPSNSQVSKKRRRLGQSVITEEAASLACAHASPEDRDSCIFDVMATQDKEDMAGSF